MAWYDGATEVGESGGGNSALVGAIAANPAAGEIIGRYWKPPEGWNLGLAVLCGLGAMVGSRYDKLGAAAGAYAGGVLYDMAKSKGVFK